MNRYFFLSVFCQGFIGSLLATLGFGVLFNVRSKQLYAAGFTGGLAGLVYRLCLYFNWTDPLSNFMAAIVLSICSEIFARLLKTTVSTYSACGLIPLVPGGTAYKMMVEFSSGRVLNGLLKGLDVVSISGMLAMGILFVSTLTRFFFYSQKKMQSARKKISGKGFYPRVISNTQLHNPFKARRIADPAVPQAKQSRPKQPEQKEKLESDSDKPCSQDAGMKSGTD